MNDKNETILRGGVSRRRTMLAYALLAALVTLALSGCPPLEEPPKRNGLQEEQQLVDDLQDALEDLEQTLKINEQQIDNIVTKLQGVSQERLNQAITDVAAGIRTQLRPILPARYVQAARDAQGSGALQAAQDQDTTPPTVTRLEVYYPYDFDTLDRPLTCVDSISIYITFSEPVVVTGTPRLLLAVGSTERPLDVDPWWQDTGSAFWTWSFRYTVKAGDRDTDGISFSRLDPAGGTIQDVAQNDAVLDLASAARVISYWDDDGPQVGPGPYPTVDGSDSACQQGLYLDLQAMVDGLTELRDKITREDFFLSADDIDESLEHTIDALQDFNRQEFADLVDAVLQAIDDALRRVEEQELPDQVYRVVHLIEDRHVREVLTIINLLREIAERGVEEIGAYRTQRTLRLVQDVAQELHRLGSERKLRRILDIASDGAPDLVVGELRKLGVGARLGPVVDAIGDVLDEVAEFIEENVL